MYDICVLHMYTIYILLYEMECVTLGFILEINIKRKELVIGIT